MKMSGRMLNNRYSKINKRKRRKKDIMRSLKKNNKHIR